MKNLLTAIIARYQGDSTLSLVPGPYLNYAPDRYEFPYCVMQTIMGPPLMLTYGSDYLEPILLQFSFMDVSDSTVLDYQAALHTRFHRQPLTLSSGSMLACTRQHSPLVIPSKPIINGESVQVFHSPCTYRFVLQKS